MKNVIYCSPQTLTLLHKEQQRMVNIISASSSVTVCCQDVASAQSDLTPPFVAVASRARQVEPAEDVQGSGSDLHVLPAELRLRPWGR